MRSSVAIVSCPDYESGAVRRAVLESLALLGGLERLLRPGSRVFVKINHLSPGSSPERAILTHPSFAREVLRLLKEAGCKVTVGDDIADEDGGGFGTSGYRELCRELGVRLINVREAGFVEVPCRGELLTSLRLSRACLEAEAVVNLPKLKTHAYTVFTGAIKNLYGLIPLGDRLLFHRMFPRVDRFSRMLVDILACLPPALNIMDAVLAMEGLGPSFGIPRRLGLVLAGPDPVALDAVAGRIAGLSPENVPTTRLAHERGLGVGRLEAVDVLGRPLASVECGDFKSPKVALRALGSGPFSSLYAFVQSRMGYEPLVDGDRCSGCGRCAAICPAGAIAPVGGRAVIAKAGCIKCLCCYEVCREGGLRLRPTLTNRLVAGLESASRLLKRRRA